MLSIAVVLLLFVIAMVAYPQFSSPSETSIIVRSNPGDAIVEVNGKTKGLTKNGSLVIDGLTPGERYKIRLHKEGNIPSHREVVPRKGTIVDLSFTLEAKPSRVLLDSTPRGAEVLFKKQLLGKTPYSTESLPPGEKVQLLFRHYGFTELKKEFRVPNGGGEGILSVDLEMSPDFGSIAITSTPKGATILIDGRPLSGKKTPIQETLVAAGKSVQILFRKPGFMPVEESISVNPRERLLALHKKLQPGGTLTIRSKLKNATVKGIPQCASTLPITACPLPNGKYALRIEAPNLVQSKIIPINIHGDDLSIEPVVLAISAPRGYELLFRGKKFSTLVFHRPKDRIEVLLRSTKNPRIKKNIAVNTKGKKQITLTAPQ